MCATRAGSIHLRFDTVDGQAHRYPAVPIEKEGAQYKLGGITFKGNKAIVERKGVARTGFKQDGEYFNATLFKERYRSAAEGYGQLGYILNFVPTPTIFASTKLKKLIYLGSGY